MITSTKNPRIIETRKLTQRKHRVKQNRFLVVFSGRFLKRTENIYLPKKEIETLNPHILANLFFDLIKKDKKSEGISIKKDRIVIQIS